MYFKYRARIVWDKRVRLDDVFGSQGGMSITQACAEHDAAHPRTDNDGADKHTGPADNGPDRDVEDDDDEADSSDESEAAAHRSASHGDANRPNYFLCIKIDDPKIQFAAQRVQESVVQFDGRLTSACLPASALHVTLLTMRIATAEQLARAQATLAAFQPQLCGLIEPGRRLQFKGVAVFRDRVLFGQLAARDNGLLRALVGRLTEAFTAAGIRLVGNHADYTAHMTLVKLGRQLCRQLHHIPQGAYLPLEHTHFGEQRVEAVHLCRMTPDRDSTGFYHRLASVPNAPPTLPADDYAAAVALQRSLEPESRHVIIMRGLPGAGKSTLIEAMAQVLDVVPVVCSADKFYADAKCTRTAANIADAHAACLAAFAAAVRSHERVVVVDNTNSQPREYEQYVLESERAGYKVLVVEMQCAARALVATLCQRSRHNVPLDACLAMYDRWQHDPHAVHVAPWTPAPRPVEAAAHVEPKPEGAVAAADGFDVQYLGIFLQGEARARLLTLVPALHSTVSADHVTLVYQPSLSQLAEAPIGQAVDIRLVSAVHNGCCQCVAVRIESASVASNNRHPHITISTAPGTEAVYSNELLADPSAATVEPLDVVLQGVVGAKLVANSGDHHSLLALTRAQLLARRLGSKAALATDEDDGQIHTLHVFDFDGTLCDTLDRVEAVWEYQRLTGCVWPHRDFFTRAESLMPPLHLRPGPALPVLRQFAGAQLLHCHYRNTIAGRRNTHTVVLSGRPEATRSALTDVLCELGSLPDAILLKPTVETPSVAFKCAALLRLLDDMPHVRTVKVFEDDLEAIAAFRGLQPAHAVSIKVADSAELAAHIDAKLHTERSAIKCWLQRSGFSISDEERHGIDETLTLISQTWLSVLTNTGCAFGDAAIDARTFALPFGSQPLGRRSDLDLCLLAPDTMTPMHCVQLLAAALQSHAIHHTYVANSERCPRLKTKIPLRRSAPLDVDIVFACVGKSALIEHARGAATLEQLAASVADKASRTALQGPLFLRDVQARIARSTVEASAFVNLIDFTKATLSRANLTGNAFHCMRTFHIVSLLADFAAQCTSRPSNFDLLFASFAKFCAAQSHESWAKRFDNFVPPQHIPLLMEHFQRQQQATEALSSTPADTTRMPIETLQLLLQRQPFPPPGFIACRIASAHADAVVHWQLGTFIKARLPTYMRRLMDQHGLALVLPCSLSEATIDCTRFAVPRTPDVFHRVAHCFEDFWAELAPYIQSGAAVTASIDGEDFFSPECVAALLAKDLDPVILKAVTAFAKADTTEPLHLESALSSAQRAIVHAVAESLGLQHGSAGVGSARHIVLCKR